MTSQIPDSAVVPTYFGLCVRVATARSFSSSETFEIVCVATPFFGLNTRACTLKPSLPAAQDRDSFWPFAGFRIATTGRILLGDRKSTRLNSSHVKISYAV